MGEKHQHDQQSNREISPGGLRHSGTCNPIRVNISTTRHLGNGGCVCGSGENDSGNLFASSFPRKDENSLTHSRNSNNNAALGGQTWPPESLLLARRSEERRASNNIEIVARTYTPKSQMPG